MAVDPGAKGTDDPFDGSGARTCPDDVSGGATAGSCGVAARAEIAYVDVRPNVALSAMPVDRMRADRAGCLSRRGRSVVIVFIRFMFFVVIFVVVIVIVVLALLTTEGSWWMVVHH